MITLSKRDSVLYISEPNSGYRMGFYNMWLRDYHIEFAHPGNKLVVLRTCHNTYQSDASRVRVYP